MANARVVWIGEPARLASDRNKSRIDCDANDVVTGRHYVLTIPSIENEILTAELPDIGVRPALAYTLIPGNVGSSANQKLSVVVIWARICAILLDINHAEPAFSGAPDVSRRWVDQFVKGVVTEVEMVVAGRKLV